MVAIVEPAYCGSEAETDDGDSHVRVEDSRLAIRGIADRAILAFFRQGVPDPTSLLQVEIIILIWSLLIRS